MDKNTTHINELENVLSKIGIKSQKTFAPFALYSRIFAPLDKISKIPTTFVFPEKLLNPMAGGGVFETINKITAAQNALLSVVRMPPIKLPSLTSADPLALYFKDMNAIATRIASIEITCHNVNNLYREFIEAKTEAENNFYHRLYVEEKEQEIAAKDEIIIKVNNRNAELETRILEYETAFRAINRLTSTIPHPRTPAALSLKSYMTPSQIARLYEDTKWLFTSTIDQWRNLFSENIQTFETPIILKSNFKADIHILFVCLKDRHLIDSHKYPSILERAKVFRTDGRIITAKQITKPVEYTHLPNVGNYDKIEAIIKAL